MVCWICSMIHCLNVICFFFCSHLMPVSTHRHRTVDQNSQQKKIKNWHRHICINSHHQTSRLSGASSKRADSNSSVCKTSMSSRRNGPLINLCMQVIFDHQPSWRYSHMFIQLTYLLTWLTDHCTPRRTASNTPLNAKATLSQALLKLSLCLLSPARTGSYQNTAMCTVNYTTMCKDLINDLPTFR